MRKLYTRADWEHWIPRIMRSQGLHLMGDVVLNAASMAFRVRFRFDDDPTYRAPGKFFFRLVEIPTLDDELTAEEFVEHISKAFDAAFAEREARQRLKEMKVEATSWRPSDG